MLIRLQFLSLFFFFFNDTATTEIYTLSLHDALPISPAARGSCWPTSRPPRSTSRSRPRGDRKSTRLNSSHQIISYAVFCLKKKTRLATVLPRDVAPLLPFTPASPTPSPLSPHSHPFR